MLTSPGAVTFNKILVGLSRSNPRRLLRYTGALLMVPLLGGGLMFLPLDGPMEAGFLLGESPQPFHDRFFMRIGL